MLEGIIHKWKKISVQKGEALRNHPCVQEAFVSDFSYLLIIFTCESINESCLMKEHGFTFFL